MELNSQLKWSDVPSYVKKTFKGSSAQHIRLDSGFRLFVLSQFSMIKSKDKRYANFFSPRRPFKGDPGLHERLRKADASPYDRVAYMRECSAFAEAKEGSRYAVEIALQQPVWGFFGVIRRQGSKVQIAGKRCYHFYIPGLSYPEMFTRVRAHDIIVKG